MSSSRLQGDARLETGTSTDSAKLRRDGPPWLPLLWLGLTWGICAPFLFTARIDGLLSAWPVAIPAFAILFVVGGTGIAWAFGRAGLDRPGAWRYTVRIATPLWVLGLSPAVLLVPLRGLPVYLAVISVSVSLARLAGLAREHFLAGRSRPVETAVFALLFVAAFVALFRVQIVHDAFQYYGYLASAALDGDLNLYNEVYLHNAERFYNPFPRESARYIGTAVLEAPWFGAAHLFVLALGALGKPVVANGYSLPYGFAVTLASAFFGLAGLVVTYRLCREFFSRGTGVIAVVAVWLASPLVFFMYVWGGWAHPFAFFFVACFLLGWQRTRHRRTLAQWAVLGVLTGAIALIRPTAGLVLVFPLLEWVALLRPRSDADAPRWTGLLFGPGLAAVLASLVFSPQLSIWKAMSGSWLAAPYGEVGDYHDWWNPDFLGMLFSTEQHGLFSWTPLLLVAAAGLFALYRRERLLAVGAIVVTILTFYVYACWSIWWTGIGFSNRFFIELTPLWALGLAALVSWLQRRVSRDWIVAAVAFAAVWNLFLVCAYRSNDIPQGIPDPYRVVDDPLTLADLAGSGLQVAPAGRDAAWLDWIHDGLITERIAAAFKFSDPGSLLSEITISLMVAAACAALIRALLAARFVAGTVRGAVILVAGSLVVALAVHVAIGVAATPRHRFGSFHHLPEIDLLIQQPAADTWVYSDHPLPVTSLDLLTQLNYGHGVNQGDVVAAVTVYDKDGRACTRTLRAGIDTAEASWLRPEYREAIRHGIHGTEIARAVPSRIYSRHAYEMLTYRSVFDLPEPLVVTKIRIRYLHPVGRLIVSDIFLRDFR